jgi:hypothetical protein
MDLHSTLKDMPYAVLYDWDGVITTAGGHALPGLCL